MDNSFSMQMISMQKQQAVQELRESNERSSRFGLVLSESQIQNLVERRFDALRDTGRVEFGEGVFKKLVWAFCDSTDLTQENYEDSLAELQDAFYYYKNESEDQVSDDELIELMRQLFDTKAHGSVEYLAGTSLEELFGNNKYRFEKMEKEED